jgi:signal transduction histidine kinase
LSTVVFIVDWFNLALFSALAIVALAQWRAGRGRAGIWAALSFGVLALVVDVARALPDERSTTLDEVAIRLLVAALVLFPYLLYRFTTAFRAAPRRLERLLGLMTAVVLVWTFVLPEFPEEGEPRPASFLAYLIAFLVHWTALSIVVTVRLWRSARHQPSVARRRMELFGFGAAAITLTLLVSGGLDPAEDSALALVVSLLATLSALAFLLGLAPPTLLRVIWRRPEQRRLQDAMADLIALKTSEEEVARHVLLPMAAIVGARGVALQADDGRIIASHEVTGAMLDQLEAAGEVTAPHSDLVVMTMPFGRLAVWTSPYAPYFGGDELRVLQTLGSVTGLALDRVRLFAQEREARIQLEHADELKTHFVALASHELRTPVTTIHGLARTLHIRGADLSDELRDELERTLVEQTARMASLVEQLLDLSRLDAHAIPIEPEPIGVRREVEEIVATAAGERADDISVEIDPDLVTVADRNALDRIVSNLVVNALRHGGAPVRLTAVQRDRHLRLAVEDRGPGIAPEFQGSLFERFARGAEARTPGTGLGLAIARAYARAQGGDLVYRAAEPTGARFEVVLPVRNGAPGLAPG